MHGCFKKIYKLKLENNTQVFLTNPCFLKKMVYNVLHDTLMHPQKTWICQKKLCYFVSLRQDRMTELICTNFVSFLVFFGMRNVFLVGLMQICEAK